MGCVGGAPSLNLILIENIQERMLLRLLCIARPLSKPGIELEADMFGSCLDFPPYHLIKGNV